MLRGPMTKTERLHYDDPLRLEMKATVVAHALREQRPAVILDSTAFYPESGGQMGDRGHIGEARVVDVQLDPDGLVHHMIEGSVPPIGATVLGRVEPLRRRQHMALHSAQHALSRVVLDLLGAVTISSRLGESACTIDVDRDGLGLEALQPAEDRVNALIDEDRPVRQWFPDDAELERLALRKPPPETDRVRVVAIDGFDATPCGGTHVTHTAQIELVFIQSVERYKGGSRITFAAGPRARRILRDDSARLRALAGRLRCSPPEVGGIVESLHDKLEAARGESGALRARLAEGLASQLADEGPEIIAVIERGDRMLLLQLAERLSRKNDPPVRLVALAAPQPDGTDVVIARGEGSDVACGALLKSIAAACGGRGGGRPELAQGRLPADIDWARLVREGMTALRATS